MVLRQVTRDFDAGVLDSLEHLSLLGVPVTSLPSLASCTALQTLNLELNRLPPAALTLALGQAALASCGTLTVLRLSHCGLTDLPAALGSAHQLRDLQLPGNRLTTVPACVSQLTALTALNVSENKLVRLPAFVWRLPAGAAASAA